MFMVSDLLPDQARYTENLRIAAIVVTHNRLDQLQVTLTRLLAEPLDHILVFDNASDDGTAEWLEGQTDPRLLTCLSKRNLGGAGGFARALEQVTGDFDPDWVVLMDDDGRPAPGSIAAFRAMDHSNWDALGAAVVTPTGEICEMNRPYRNPFWRLPEFLRTLSGQGRRGFHLNDSAYRPDAPRVEVDMSSFVGLFLSRRAWQRAGLPDERLFIYGDDQLYTLTMRRQGLRIGFAPEIRFEHDTRSMQGERGVVLRPMWKVYYMYRNALIAYRVAAGPWFWPLVPLLIVKWRRKARDYGADAPEFHRLLRLALRDGLGRQLDRQHSQISGPAS